MPTLALTLSYDGRGFAGSQVQPGVRTVQGELSAALARLFGRPVAGVFAGRTDRGVHAAGQVVSIDVDRDPADPARIRSALNWHLPKDVAVLRVEGAAPSFNARFDAHWREYRYRLWFGQPAPLAEAFVWSSRADCESGPMEQASRLLLGTHDFASFAGNGDGVPWSGRRNASRGTVRTLFASDVRELEPWWSPPRFGRLIEYRIAADGFLPRMVRSIVAALVEIGRGKRSASWLTDLLGQRDRRAGAGTAPPSGLTLWRVGYAAFPGEGTFGKRSVRDSRGAPPTDGYLAMGSE